MSKPFSRSTAVILGAAALLSFHAQAADAGAQADPWPVEVPAQVYFGDTDNYGTGPRRPDVAASVGFGDPAAQDGPVVTASSSIVDSQRLELRDRLLAEQRQRAATALAHRDGGGSGRGME